MKLQQKTKTFHLIFKMYSIFIIKLTISYKDLHMTLKRGLTTNNQNKIKELKVIYLKPKVPQSAKNYSTWKLITKPCKSGRKG